MLPRQALQEKIVPAYIGFDCTAKSLHVGSLVQIMVEKGKMIYRAPSPQAIDFYLTSGFAQTGERIWHRDEIPGDTGPFRPCAGR